jgi:hypothetical protein
MVPGQGVTVNLIPRATITHTFSSRHLQQITSTTLPSIYVSSMPLLLFLSIKLPTYVYRSNIFRRQKL